MPVVPVFSKLDLQIERIGSGDMQIFLVTCDKVPELHVSAKTVREAMSQAGSKVEALLRS